MEGRSLVLRRLGIGLRTGDVGTRDGTLYARRIGTFSFLKRQECLLGNKSRRSVEGSQLCDSDATSVGRSVKADLSLSSQGKLLSGSG